MLTTDIISTVCLILMGVAALSIVVLIISQRIMARLEAQIKSQYITERSVLDGIRDSIRQLDETVTQIHRSQGEMGEDVDNLYKACNTILTAIPSMTHSIGQELDAVFRSRLDGIKDGLAQIDADATQAHSEQCDLAAQVDDLHAVASKIQSQFPGLFQSIGQECGRIRRDVEGNRLLACEVKKDLQRLSSELNWLIKAGRHSDTNKVGQPVQRKNISS